MRKAFAFVVVIVVAVGLGYFASKRLFANQAGDNNSTPTPSHVHRTQPDNSSEESKSGTDTADGKQDDVESALTSLFQKADREDGPLPKGVKVLSVKVEKGIATIDLSKEFNGLKEHGSTTESSAQASLRHTLARFPQVQKMLVLVEGKPFESEHTEWNEPLSVREANAEAGQ